MMIILYICLGIIITFISCIGILICFRNLQILYKFYFKNKICYPLIKTHTGFWTLVVIDSVDWYWCNISNEKKPKHYLKHFIKYPPYFIENFDRTEKELIKH